MSWRSAASNGLCRFLFHSRPRLQPLLLLGRQLDEPFCFQALRFSTCSVIKCSCSELSFSGGDRTGLSIWPGVGARTSPLLVCQMGEPFHLQALHLRVWPSTVLISPLLFETFLLRSFCLWCSSECRECVPGIQRLQR